MWMRFDRESAGTSHFPGWDGAERKVVDVTEVKVPLDDGDIGAWRHVGPVARKLVEDIRHRRFR
jgi:hypothetical protein